MELAPMLHADHPARYRIRLQGALDSSLSTLFQGMDVVCLNDPDVTVLLGEVLDQAALLGVLNFLYNLGHPLLSVEYLDETYRVHTP